MASLDDTISLVSGIEAAVEDALRTEVADVVKEALARSAKENVYDAYAPKFKSRRGEKGEPGGITDPDSIKITVSGNELVAEDIAEWQHLWGGVKPKISLAEGIASGSGKYYMHKAGPRPFHEQAKEDVISSGEAERALIRGLQRQGYDVTDMTIRFS